MKLIEPTKYLGHTAAGVKKVLIKKQLFEGNVKKKRSQCVYNRVQILRISFYGSFIWYLRKMFRKTNISEPLIRTRTCT